jgi:threonine dehydrogenase-like Zn-dependent dehydrogenase
VQKYFEVVMKALQQQQIDSTLMVTHRLTLDQVPKAYEELFYRRVDTSRC